MKKLFCVVLACVMLFSFAACGSSTPANNNSAAVNPENAILRIGAANDWNTESMTLVFDTLTYRINSYSASKQIIEVVPNADYTEYTLKVTPGITFSDGTKVDAECVKYSIEKEALANTLGFHQLMKSLEVKDENTLVAKFDQPFGTFEYELSYILCVKVGAVSPEGNITEYIGTGMYTLEDFVPGSSAKFAYNENYWNAAEKKPTVTTVDYKVMPELATRVLALQKKEIDVIGITEHGHVNDYVTLKQLQEDKSITIDMTAGGAPSMYMFNYTKGATEDKVLRTAISLAVDRQHLCDSICFGFAVPAFNYIPNESQYAPKNGVKFEFNVEQAKKILEEAGYKDTNGNGILEKNGDGKDIVLSIVTLSSETYRNTAVLVKEDLAKIGIGVEVEALDAQSYYAKSQTGKFDMCFTHPWKQEITYYTWRCWYSDYDTMGTGFGFDPKFKDSYEVVSAGLDTEAIQKFFDGFWDESYEFIPALTLYSGGAARCYTDEVTGFIWGRGDGTLNLVELQNVVVNRK